MFSYKFYAGDLDGMTKVRKALFMFVDLFGLERYNYTKLVGEPLDPNLHYRSHQVRFLLTVKTNYRSVAYHNWAHGFHVANSIYSMLKNSPGVFNPLEVEVLSLHRTKKQLQTIQFIHLRSNCTFCRVCQCSLVPCATISTIVASTTSSWLTLGKKKDGAWMQDTFDEDMNILLPEWHFFN